MRNKSPHKKNYRKQESNKKICTDEQYDKPRRITAQREDFHYHCWERKHITSNLYRCVESQNNLQTGGHLVSGCPQCITGPTHRSI
uniref:Uncharacterized protein n=1 Tax=Arundo donax TaxID=35708 RepID=A0A0A9F7E8_ARUDO